MRDATVLRPATWPKHGRVGEGEREPSGEHCGLSPISQFDVRIVMV